MTQYLSEHFSYDELTHSETGARQGLDNSPPGTLLPRLAWLAHNLEKVRAHLGKPLLISSGYRSPAVNKAVGSANPNSQHTRCEAVDFTCPAFGTPALIVATLKQSGIPYDQLILEFDRWVHISFSDRPRRQTLIIDRNGARPYA